MPTTLEINQKFKEKQKIEKAADKLSKKMQKRSISIKKQYEELRAKQIAKINFKYDKKLGKRLNKLVSEYDKKRIREKKKILGKEAKAVMPTKKKMKDKALEEIQRYAKLSRAGITSDWVFINIWDKSTPAIVELTKHVNWWHVYGQKNFPHMAFEIDNIRPISWFSNKMQGDQIAQWKVNLPMDIQNRLEILAADKESKNQIRDHKFFQDIIDKYKALNEIEYKRLGLN